MKKIVPTVRAMLVFLVAITTVSCAATSTTTTVAPTNQNGIQLANFLNSLHVENFWAKGQDINWETGATITGPITHWATDSATHCSGYASSVAAMLNIPLLHPPFPSGTFNGVTYTSRFANTYGKTFSDLAATSDSLLADKQGTWLDTNAQETLPATPYTTASVKNWVHINAYQAQSYANQGYFAVVVYENPKSSSPGHIAIIAPFQSEAKVGNYPNKTTAYISLAVDGPYVAQSGGFNSSYTTVSRGFAPPDGPSLQWLGADSSQNLVKFYVYYMPIDWNAVSVPPAVK